MKPTINDVAKLANVSKATVSRVLNDKNNVSEVKRKQVLMAIEQIKYQPSSITRNFGKQSNSLIGVIIPDITNPFFPSISQGVEDAANYKNYTVVLCNTDNDPSMEMDLIQQMENQLFKGIILVTSYLSDRTKKMIEHSTLPFVLCDRLNNDLILPTVGVDNVQVGIDVVEYLYKLGHREIIHVCGSPKVQSAIDRKTGYKKAMEKCGLKPYVIQGSFNYETGYEIGKKLLSSKLISTAIFASNDLLAVGIINSLQDVGIKVPDDVSVVGCDDSFVGKICRPKLTTVRQPVYQMGSRAFELLEELIQAQNDIDYQNKKIILNHKLIERSSTISRGD